jgi:CRP/FNR family transcriptional regulator, anaerobic regulatory protein
LLVSIGKRVKFKFPIDFAIAPAAMPTSTFAQSFPDLAKEPIQSAILQASRHRKLAADTVLVLPGDTIVSIPLVLSGSLKVTTDDAQGREMLLYHVRAGESCVVTIFSALQPAPSPLRAIATEPSEVLLLPVAEVRHFALNQPLWNQFVLWQYHKRFGEVLHLVNELAFKKMDARLWDLLLRKAKAGGSAEISTTHQALADELGTAREVVSRLLKVLETEAAIELSRGKIKILRFGDPGH